MSTHDVGGAARRADEPVRRIDAVRGGVERALADAGDLRDPVIVVLAALPQEDVRALARGDAVDLLLDLGESGAGGDLKPLAARLLVHPGAPPGELLAALVEPGETPWLGPIPRPELARERARRAEKEIAALCIDRRGLSASASERPVRFAVRAHRCSLCSSWAMVLSDFGLDLAALTAPDAGRARVRKLGSGALCAACALEREDVLALARTAGLDEKRAIAAMMPSAVLAHLDLAKARRLRAR